MKLFWVVAMVLILSITAIGCRASSDAGASFPGHFASFGDALYLQSDQIDESAVGDVIGHTNAFPCRWTDTNVPFKPGDGPGLEEGLAVESITGSKPIDQIAIEIDGRLTRFRFYRRDC